ncbi:uncharacterized protein MEPE_03873 [Melanopsichium pennsylvanicum]|uniref:Uncharacterized protein n=1 Tax=Melanopsichium pennsylvanicum TaxID=63383 RepID=A0AAJ4XLS8_9BASI|nr:uncharacterized protein MEPE_03873 [Melanopsichium pennsylvanicum]
MAYLLSKFLPLAGDPFPPTHKAGSEFEGFFIRLESHSGRSQACSQAPTTSSKNDIKAESVARSSPSRIPRLSKAPVAESASFNSSHSRHRRHRSSSSTSSSSSFDAAGTSSPTPTSKRSSVPRLSSSALTSSHSTSMLTNIDPVFASPESLIPNPPSTWKSHNELRSTLPTSAPGDLILVVCELQSAPIDERICIYLRWIVHGEEPNLYQSLHSDSPPGLSNGNGRAERLPNNSTQNSGKGKGKQTESFEIIKYIPSWQLKVGAKVDSGSVQPFRIDLPSETGGNLGFMQVFSDGNVSVDLTLLNPGRSRSQHKSVATRIRLRTTCFSPWHPKSCRTSIPSLGSRGPEGWIQHFGFLLPLHWYVHSSSAPAMFSVEHVSYSPCSSALSNESEELKNVVAAGKGLVHIEKNWGQAFPSGWMWCHGASPLPDPSLPKCSPNQPSLRLSLAGGSILGLTAFLVGIHIKQTQVEGQGKEWDWNFSPPTALGPQFSLGTSKGNNNAKIHFGPGLRMQRNFFDKTFQLEVWDSNKWASINVKGDQDEFATQIPGPIKGGWKAEYCHHSYRCRASIILYERSFISAIAMPLRVALNPFTYIKACKAFWQGQNKDEVWHKMGWHKVIQVELTDRVALEFGGDFAQ